MSQTYIGDAHSHFCLRDEQAGYPETRRHLQGYSQEQLLREYQDAVRDSFGKMFGHNARKFGNLVVDELTARGVTAYADIFGAVPIRPFR